MLNYNSKTILFITGAFVSNTIWNEWRAFFDNKGYTTHAPAWPYKDAPVAVLRQRHPDAQVASLRLTQLVEHYEAIAGSLPEKPIIIGHSMGGLVAQILTEKEFAASAILLHSVPPQGIFTFKLSFLRAGWGALGFFTDTKKTFMMDFKQWQYAFANGMPEACQEDGYELYAIPESKLIVRDTTTAAAKVNFDKPHSPLLFIAGSTDHAIPQSLNSSNYKRYKENNSIVDYKVFGQRNHFVIGQPGWQEIAIYIDEWLQKL